jgi:antitoxin component of RelBE/YafQ-DinJ toxin-antitoxin module
MKTQHLPHRNREALLKVRVREDTKRSVIAAARALDLDQSSLVRLAVQEFIARHPHAA